MNTKEMNAKDWFGIAVRVLGLWEIMNSASNFVASYGISAGWWDGARDTEKYYILLGLSQAIVGIGLLSAADKIVSFAYRQTEPVDLGSEPPPDERPGTDQHGT